MALTQDDLQSIGEIVEKKVQSAKEEILTQMAKDREDMAEFFQKTWEMMEPSNAEINERVTALEEQAHSHKN